MRPEEFQRFLHQKPFRPFRVTLTDSRNYVVAHPELAMVGKSLVFIGLPDPKQPTNGDDKDGGPLFDRHVFVSLLHIMQVDYVETAASS